MVMLVMVVGKGWCGWRGLPEAAVIRDVLQAPCLARLWSQDPHGSLQNQWGCVVSICARISEGVIKDQITEWYMPIAQGKENTLMAITHTCSVLQWPIDRRQKKTVWDILFLSPQCPLFHSRLPYLLLSSSALCADWTQFTVCDIYRWLLLWGCRLTYKEEINPVSLLFFSPRANMSLKFKWSRQFPCKIL